MSVEEKFGSDLLLLDTANVAFVLKVDIMNIVNIVNIVFNDCCQDLLYFLFWSAYACYCTCSLCAEKSTKTIWNIRASKEKCEASKVKVEKWDNKL